MGIINRVGHRCSRLLSAGALGCRLLLAEAAIRLWSLPTITAHLDRRRRRRPIPIDAQCGDLTELAGWIERVDHHGPWRPSCLRQALVLAWLLSGHGIAATLRIGVKKDDGQLQAHAWLELKKCQTPPKAGEVSDTSFAVLAPARAG